MAFYEDQLGQENQELTTTRPTRQNIFDPPAQNRNTELIFGPRGTQAPQPVKMPDANVGGYQNQQEYRNQLDAIMRADLTPSAPQTTQMPTPQAQMGTEPSQMRPMTPEEIARQDAIRAKLEGEPQYPAIKEGSLMSQGINLVGDGRYTAEEQQQIEKGLRLKEMKLGVGVRAITNSLEKQGMSRDDIAREIGYTEGMSKADALKGLQRLQLKRVKAQTADGLDNRVRTRAIENARFDVDEQGNEIPKNTEARAKQFIDRVDDLGPDPDSETSLYDSMSQGERRQYDRTIRSMSQGTKDPNSERRLKALIEKVEEKADRKYLQKQSKASRTALETAAKRVKLSEDTETRLAQAARLKAWKDEIDTLTKEREKAKGDRKDQIDARRAEVNKEIEQFNKGDVAPQAQTGLMSLDDFIADFTSEEGVAPTEAQIAALKGKAWN